MDKELDALLQNIIEKKGGTKKDYNDLMNKIAYHESAGTLDPKIHQYGNGPGRGLFQYEEGNHKGGIIAVNRTYKYLKDNNLTIPNWLKEAYKYKSFDASTIDANKQKILFLGNMMEHPRADFSKVWNKEQTLPEFWASYHWAGSSKDRRERLKAFNTSIDSYNKKNQTDNNIIFTFADNNKVNINPKTNQTTVDSFAFGGNLYNTLNKNKYLNSFNVGGTHEQNPLGGIPQGKNDNGGINKVEQGETSFDLDMGKYVFSDRIKIN